MEEQIITLADQEIATRLATRKHILKDIDQIIDWKRINKILSKLPRYYAVRNTNHSSRQRDRSYS